MIEKTCIPYDRTDDPPQGASVITCKVYGEDRAQAMDRYNYAKKPKQAIGGEPQPFEQGSRWVVMWQESIPQLADVIRPSVWNRRKGTGQSK